MIVIYAKSGSIQNNNVITFILKSQKHKWTKAHKINKKIADNQFTRSIVLDAINITYALKHIKDKYRKKKIIVHNDSGYISTALKKKNGQFENNTKIAEIEELRNVVGSFNNIHFKKFTSGCKFLEELDHILIECALDFIEIDEKD